MLVTNCYKMAKDKFYDKIIFDLRYFSARGNKF